MFKGIRWQLILNYMIVIAIIVILMGLLFTWFLNYFYMQTLRENLYIQARLAASAIEELAGRNAESAEIDQFCKELGRELNLRITVIDDHGLVLADSAQDPALMENHGDRPEVIEALRLNKGVAVRYSATLDEQMFYLAVPLNVSLVNNNAGGKALVRLALPLAAINEVIRNLVVYIFGGLLIASLIAMVAAILVSSKIIGPIHKISQASKAIAAGDFYPSVEVSGSDELASLALNIRDMGEALDQKMNQVLLEKNKLETVVSSMSSGIIFTDPQLKIELINPAAEKLFEVKKLQVIGYPIKNTVRYFALYENMKAVREDGEARMLEMALYYPRNLVLETYILPVPDQESQVSGILLLFHEVTHLRSVEKMRSDFVANVSHELRTPLTAIKGYTETILNEKLPHDQLLEFLQIIDRETSHLATLLDELLDLSRLENEKSFIKKEPLRLVSLIDEALNRVDDLAKEKGFHIEKIISAPSAMASGNFEWLCQALVNILENSIRHGNYGGQLWITLSTDENKALIEIKDDGPGIPRADLPYVFERFYRVDKARSRKSGGTGLGLSIVKHIMEAHGAPYSLDSCENSGTRFQFNLTLL